MANFEMYSDTDAEEAYNSQDSFDITNWDRHSIAIAKSKTIDDKNDEDSSTHNDEYRYDSSSTSDDENERSREASVQAELNVSKGTKRRAEPTVNTCSTSANNEDQDNNSTELSVLRGSAIQRLKQILDLEEGTKISLDVIDEALTAAKVALKQQEKQRDDLLQQQAAMQDAIDETRNVIKQVEALCRKLKKQDVSSGAHQLPAKKRRDSEIPSSTSHFLPKKHGGQKQKDSAGKINSTQKPLNVSFIARLLDDLGTLEKSMDTKDMLYAIIAKIAQEKNKINMWQLFFKSRQRKVHLAWDNIIDIFFKNERDGRMAEDWYLHFCKTHKKDNNLNEFNSSGGNKRKGILKRNVNSCNGKIGKYFIRKNYRNVMAALLVKLYFASEVKHKPALDEMIWKYAKPCLEKNWNVWCRRISLPNDLAQLFPGSISGENNIDDEGHYARQQKDRKKYMMIE